EARQGASTFDAVDLWSRRRATGDRRRRAGIRPDRVDGGRGIGWHACPGVIHGWPDHDRKRGGRRHDGDGRAPVAGRRMTSVRVLLADDHAVGREGRAAMIGRQPDMTVVAEADNGIEALELWRTHRPDVTLLDLRMPGLDGI